MKIEIRNPKSVAAGILPAVEGARLAAWIGERCIGEIQIIQRSQTVRAFPPGGTPGSTAGKMPAATSAFTLIEVLLAMAILAILMAVVHSIFFSAIHLRNQADQAFEDAIPVQHTLALMKRDLSNLTVPGGTLTGTFQTAATAGSKTSSATHSGQQAGPSFYTASGTVTDSSAWGEIQKVTYYLTPATKGGNGLDLIRSVTRNLLPVLQEEYADQRLMGGVNSLKFQFYNGTQWMDAWDSTATSASSGTTNTLPQGIRVQLTLAVDAGKLAPAPIEMVVPVIVQASTNSTTGGGG